MSPGLLASLRSAHASVTLVDACDIMVRGGSQDSTGAPVAPYSTARATGVRCSVQRIIREPKEHAVGGGDTMVAEWVVSLPFGTVVDKTDRIRVAANSAAADGAPVWFEITDITDAKEAAQTVKAVCRKVA